VPAAQELNRKQAFFRSMLVGVLLYSVVLGFFNDYTEILHTGSYSVTFAVAIVMQILTFLTFAAKDFAVRWFRRRGGPKHKVGIVFSVWLIMFLSKFVFLAAIAVVFQGSVQVIPEGTGSVKGYGWSFFSFLRRCRVRRSEASGSRLGRSPTAERPEGLDAGAVRRSMGSGEEGGWCGGL